MSVSYTYSLVNVPGASETEAYGINNSGQVVGFYFDGTSPGSDGFLDTNGTISKIDAPGAIATYAFGIDNFSQIVGVYLDSTGYHGFLDTNGTFSKIDIPGASYIEAHGINASGQVVGLYQDSTGFHGFLDTNGTFSKIDVPGASFTLALGVNDSGQVVGAYHDGTGYHGFQATPVQSITLSVTFGSNTIGPAGTATPFSAATITDPNSGQTETVVASLSNPALGALSDPAHASDGSTYGSGGAVTLTGSATAVAQELNSLVFTPSSPVASGTPSTGFTVTVTDTAGQTVSQSGGTVIVDATPPAVTAVLANNTGSSATDKITSDPTLTGSGDANATVTIRNGTSVLDTTVADGTGKWSFKPIGLADGTYNLTASETDAAGNTGSASTGFTLDTTAPKIAITSKAGLTNQTAQTVTGTGDAGTTIAVLDGATKLGTAMVGTDGNWSTTATLSGDGAHSLTAADIDVAGNTGTSAAVSYMLDTTPPKTAITDVVQTSTKAGSSTTISGTTEAGSTVTLYDTGGTAVIATITADVVTGKWSFLRSNLSDVVHDFTARAVDAAGNTGPGSNHAFFGSNKNDALVGTSGNDLLIGSGGNDAMRGGAGADTFAFHSSFGKNVIGDFDPTQDLLAFDKALVPSTVTSDASLASYALSHTTQIAGASVITFDAQNTVTLTGVAKSALVASDFRLIG